MAKCSIGSIWTVGRDGGDIVAIIAGPFGKSATLSEYCAAPIYFESRSGFRWTSEDVRLTDSETGLGRTAFVAIWNARPILERDLELQRGLLSENAAIAVRDAYWASLNDQASKKNPRLGTRIRSGNEPVAKFQAEELTRWEPYSARVMGLAEMSSAPLQSTHQRIGLIEVCLRWAGKSRLFNAAEIASAFLPADPESIRDDLVPLPDANNEQKGTWLGGSVGAVFDRQLAMPESIEMSPLDERTWRGRLQEEQTKVATDVNVAKCA